MAGDNQQPDKETAKAIQQHAGDDFLATTAHVARDVKGSNSGAKRVVAIQGGRLVSELKGDEKLSADEVDELTKAGAIRPASADDVRSAVARATASETAKAEGERRRAVQTLEAEQNAERQAIVEKHNAARDKELAALADKHTTAREKLDKKYAPEGASK